MCSYGKFGRILLEIAPVSITETCLHKGAEGDKWEGWCEHGWGKRKGLHQMDCCGSAISTSLAACGDFFPWLLGLFFSAELCSSD